MAEQTKPAKVNEMRVTKGKLTQMSSTIAAGNPVGTTLPSVFGRRELEDALDKVSRPVKTPEKAS